MFIVYWEIYWVYWEIYWVYWEIYWVMNYILDTEQNVWKCVPVLYAIIEQPILIAFLELRLF